MYMKIDIRNIVENEEHCGKWSFWKWNMLRKEKPDQKSSDSE